MHCLPNIRSLALVSKMALGVLWIFYDPAICNMCFWARRNDKEELLQHEYLQFHRLVNPDGLEGVYPQSNDSMQWGRR